LVARVAAVAGGIFDRRLTDMHRHVIKEILA
jgi:hypothetical protein